MPAGNVSYRIDSRDRIVAVGDEWLAFARENGAPELSESAVVGERWPRFVADPETRALYASIFERVRSSEAEITLPFRCDAPDRFRFMRLVISPGRDGTLTCKGMLDREQARPFYSILDRAFPRSDRSLRICSLCRKIAVSETEWVEVEAAVARLDLFDSTRLPRLEEAGCPGCRSVALRQLNEASHGAA